jgi:transmembrane sensor
MADNPIELEAAEWLARLDRSDVGVETRAAFEKWKTADPRHAGAFARLEATWQALDRLQGIKPPSVELEDPDFLNRPDLLRGPRSADGPAFEPRVIVGFPTTRSGWNSARRRRAGGFALAAAVGLGVAVLWYGRAFPSGTTYVTSKGGFQTIVLGDHSTIELNTDTEVRVAMSTALRQVKLVRGEASFDVAHDMARPFVVVAGETAVRAVGTRFDVRRVDGSIEVMVSEGRVAIGASAALVKAGMAVPPSMPTVSAGQRAVAGGVEVKMQPISAEVTARKLAWQGHRLAFEAEPLAQVVAEFNRYNDRELVIDDPRIASLKIGGYFRPTNLDAFVKVLESNFGVRAVAEGDRLNLESTDTEPK